jgi:hypothetical protein
MGTPKLEFTYLFFNTSEEAQLKYNLIELDLNLKLLQFSELSLKCNLSGV